MVRIGKESTDELECVPPLLYPCYIRYKYAAKNKEGVVIAIFLER